MPPLRRRGPARSLSVFEPSSCCRCEICPANRPKEAARRRKAFDEGMGRIAEDSSSRRFAYPRNRKPSAAAALNLKAEQEKRLSEAVATGEAEERARQNAVSFGTIADTYRRISGKDWKRARLATHLAIRISFGFLKARIRRSGG